MKILVINIVKFALIAILLKSTTCEIINLNDNSFISTNQACSRKCDTKYSNKECWTKSFTFFTNDFLLNSLNFLKTADMLSQYKDGSTLYSNLEFLRNDTLFDQFLQPFLNNEIKEFSDTMKIVYGKIISDYERLLHKNSIANIKGSYQLKCPRSSCFDASETSMQRDINETSILNALKICTFFFGSASIILITVYICLHIFIESQLIKTYKKL